MKIGILRRHWAGHGGGERFVRRFVQELERVGHEVHIFCERWAPPPASPVVHRVPCFPGSRTLQLLGYAVLAPRLAHAREVDVVHSFERTLHQDVFRAGEGCHRQWVMLRYRHRSQPLRTLGRARLFHRVALAIERRICQNGGARVVVVNSRMVEQDLARHYQPLRVPVVLIRNGVDLERFHPDLRLAARRAAREKLGLDEARTVLLTVGSGFQRKGVATVVSALGELRRRTFRAPILVVAGKGKEEWLRLHAAREGVADQVRPLGPVEDAWELYAAADAFVLPSLYDPASNATMEALAMGLPVVTSRNDGSCELLDAGASGWVLDEPSDVAQLTSILREITEVGGSGATAAAARQAVEPWSWARHLSENLALYARLRARPGGILPASSPEIQPHRA
jgi:UDP-glucose:(heptosyl)LPS alpha-1,3-glucosyltransferase